MTKKKKTGKKKKEKEMDITPVRGGDWIGKSIQIDEDKLKERNVVKAKHTNDYLFDN